MQEADKLFFRSLLMRERKELLKTLKKMDIHGTGIPSKDSSGELSSYDNHPAELGSQVFDFSHNLGLKINELYRIKEIDAALEKLEKGSYGICEFCGKQIARERLEVRPQARLCIDCENSRNMKLEYLMKERPVEEKVIGTPFGHKYLNQQDDDEHEGLDYLNDLMKYGSASTPQDMGGYEDYEEFYTNKVDSQGIVDRMDNISNEEYEDQLP